MKLYKLAPKHEKTEEEIVKMLQLGYVPAEFEPLNHYEIKRGDILVFRVNKKLPFQSMQRLMHNFTQGLNRLGLKGFFLTENVDIAVVLRKVEENAPT